MTAATCWAPTCFRNGSVPASSRFSASTPAPGFREGLTPDYNQKTTEVDLNYIIRQFNARLMIFFKNTSYTAVQTDDFQVGVGLQIQM